MRRSQHRWLYLLRLAALLLEAIAFTGVRYAVDKALAIAAATPDGCKVYYFEDRENLRLFQAGSGR